MDEMIVAKEADEDAQSLHVHLFSVRLWSEAWAMVL
jgi:hypothetical protein